MVISDKFIHEVKDSLLSDESYTLTRLSEAAELCIAHGAPMSAAIYYNVMREKVQRLMGEENV